MKFIISLLLAFLFFTAETQAQEKESAGPVQIGVAKAVPSQALSRKKLTPPQTIFKLYNPRKTGINKIVPGKGLPKQKNSKIQDKKGAIPGKAPIFSFDVANSQSTPTDPTGVAGRNHYVNAWNSAFSIFDKSGNQLVAPMSLSSIGGEFNGETDGDPIVLYDEFADRFVIMQFSDTQEDGSDTPAGLLIAVSQGSDPINSGWFTYRFNTNALPDYPKISVWSDGYYITTNKNPLSPQGEQIIYVLEREQMLAGGSAQFLSFPLPGIQNNGFYSPAGFNAVGKIPPPPGNAPIIYMQDDAWSGVNEDHLKLWLVNVNWQSPGSSIISESQQLGASEGVTPFISTFDGGNFSNLAQPNDAADVDALQAAMMYMTPYRRFATHNSAVMNFVVDVDPGAPKHAGIRWYELRQQSDGGPWAVHQEGTYAPDKSDRFSGSIGIDTEGNIGLGFTILDDSPANPIYPSIRYTGRYPQDALGQMTIREQSIVEGLSPNPDNRYGDYAHISVDAADGVTFWHNAEYFEGVQRINKVGVFKIAPDANNDVGVVAFISPINATLGQSEEVSISVRNFGRSAQSGFEVSFSVDGGQTFTETFTETIDALSTAEFTFSQTVDMSNVGQEYQITATTNLLNDQAENNDSFTETIINLPPKDVGVTSIDSPFTDQNLTSSEEVTVTIENFGGAPQENIPVSYVIGNNLKVNEVFTGVIPVGEQRSYTFNKEANLSVSGSYKIIAQTNLEGDFDTSNDAEEKTIANLNCIPEGSDCAFGDGISYFELGDILNERIPCGDGYEDFTGNSTELDRSKGTFSVTVQSYFAENDSEQFSMWIDLNDDAVFSDDEMVITSQVIPLKNNPFTFEFSLPLDAPLGQHLLRIRAGDVGFSGDLNDPCSVMKYGATHDYSVEIVDSTLDLEDFLLNEAKLYVLSDVGNKFKFVLETSFEDPLRITVFNIVGQQMLENEILNQGSGYTYELDMSYAARGVYLVRVGTRKVGKVKRFIVK